MSWIHTSPAQEIRVGAGVARRMRPFLKAADSRRAVLLRSPGHGDSELGAQIERGIGSSLAGTFDEAATHTPSSSIQAAMRVVTECDADAIISVGGGSVIDLGKALAFFVERAAGTPAAGFSDRPGLVHLTVPTTFVSSACTSRFVMTDADAGRASMSQSSTLLPRWVLHDTDLTEELSAEALVSTAIAGLVEGVEAVVSSVRTPEAEAVGLAGVTRLFGALPSAIDGDADQEIRTTLAEGSILVGRAQENSSGGLAQALAQLVAARSGIPYAVALSVLAVPCLQFVTEFAEDRMAQVASSLGTGDPFTALTSLIESAPLPAGLESVGLEDDDLEAVARLSQGHPFVAGLDRPLGELDVVALLESVW